MLVAIGSFAYKFYSLSSDDPLKARIAENIKMLLNKTKIESLKIKKLVDECECYSLYHQPTFTMCFFVMQKYHEMPLHDHPNMTVFIKIMSGKLLVSSYELIESDGMQLKAKKTTKIITPDMEDSFMILSPDKGPTMHRFVSLEENTVFLDIIGPPYNDEDRQCTYYQDESENNMRTANKLIKNKNLDISFKDNLRIKRSGSPRIIDSDRFDLNGNIIPLNMTTIVDLSILNIDYICKTTLYEPPI